MSVFAFRGGPVVTLDGKGRITVPSRWRDELNEAVEGKLVIAKSHSGCLSLYPRPVWEKFEAELMKLPMKHEGWIDFFIGSATDVEIDSGSRVLVPPELRDWAELTRDVKFMGAGSKFQLWDAARYAEREAKVRAGGLPEELQNVVGA